jgi:signal peptidase I
MTQKKSDGFREIAKTVGYAIVIALVIRTFLFEPFRIPSGSMIPSLLIGDYLFVAKYSYGYSKYSFPLSPDLFSGRIMESTVKRGDVVVFRPPPSPDLDFIKRIIGLPGDHIQMKQGILYINDVAVTREAIGDYVDEQGNNYTQYIETLPNGVKHRIIEVRGDGGDLDNTDVFIVPPGHYFAMGDNRDDSMDSRTSAVGYVPAENLVGKAEIIFFSTDGTAHWWEVWKWPLAVRYSRLFDFIQ